MKKALLFLIVMCTAALPLGSRDRKQEKDIDRTLSRMTLDEKIGQMILLEINQVTYYRPEFEFRTLMTYDRDKLEGIIREAGLEGKYNAATMLEQLDPNDVGSLYAFYLLSRDLCAADGFSWTPTNCGPSSGNTTWGAC